MRSKPVHAHMGCEDCIFVGGFDAHDLKQSGGDLQLDIYACTDSMKILLRFGDGVNMTVSTEKLLDSGVFLAEEDFYR